MSQLVKYRANDGVEVTLTPQTVAAYIATGNADAEPKDVVRFMATCRARGLNPLAGDCYMTVYRNRQTGQKSVSTVVSKDYFVRTAASQESFDGLDSGVVVYKPRTGEMEERVGTIVGKNSEQLVGGWAAVYDKRRSHPTKVTVALSEYDTGKSLWKSKPATMIRKVALVQALRETYPAQFGGVYDRDEMPDEMPPAPVQEPSVAPMPEPAPEPDPEPEPDEGPREPEPEPDLYETDVEF